MYNYKGITMATNHFFIRAVVVMETSIQEVKCIRIFQSNSSSTHWTLILSAYEDKRL